MHCMTVSLAQGGDGLGAMRKERRRASSSPKPDSRRSTCIPRARPVQRVLRGVPDLHHAPGASRHRRDGRVDALARLPDRDGGAGARRQRVRRAVATGFVLQVVEPHLERARRGSRGVLVGGAGSRSRSADRVLRRPAPRSSASRRARARPRPGRVLAACVPGSSRRLAPAPSRVRDLAPRRRPRVRDRLRRARLPTARAHPRDHPAQRSAPRELARLARPLPSAPSRCAVPEPGACGDVSAHRRGRAAGRARTRSRRLASRTTRGSSRTRSTASAQPREASSPAPGCVARDDRAGRQPRVPRLGRLQDAAGGRPVGSSRRRSCRASTWRSLGRRNSSTSSSRQARVRDRDASYGDAEDVPLETLLDGVQRRAAHARRRRRIG